MENLIKSIAAGMVISLGGLINLKCLTDGNAILGAFLFTIGLYSVLQFKFNLYTGKVCYVNNYKNPLGLIIVFIGNLIGCAIFSIMTWYKPELFEFCTKLCNNKLNKPYANIFIDAFLCGVCIAIAVIGYNLSTNEKYIPILLGVMVFILGGYEHVVADLFYFLSAKCVTFESVIFILITAVGNTIGGLVMGLLIQVHINRQ